MRLLLFLLFFNFLFSILYCKAQILNIEQFRPDKDTANLWLGNIAFGFSSKKQLNTVVTLSSDANVVYLSEDNSYMCINHINLVTASGSKLVSEGYSHLRFNFNRKHFISYEPFLQLQYDLGRGLDVRKLGGFTFRSDLRSVEKFVLAFNTGIMYENEIWRGEVLRFETDTSKTRAQTKFLKSTSNMSVKIGIGKNITLFSIAYYQARFNKFFQPRLITDVQLKFSFNRFIAFAIGFSSTFDALPIVDKNNFVFTFSNSLVIKIQ